MVFVHDSLPPNSNATRGARALGARTYVASSRDSQNPRKEWLGVDILSF